jgi:hypothetical protein
LEQAQRHEESRLHGLFALQPGFVNIPVHGFKIADQLVALKPIVVPVSFQISFLPDLKSAFGNKEEIMPPAPQSGGLNLARRCNAG